MAKVVTVYSRMAITLRLFRRLPGPDIHMAPDPGHEPVVLGVGENPGVDADFFAAWLKQNQKLDLVASGSIHAGEPREEEAADAAQPRRSDHDMDVDSHNLTHHLSLGQFEAFVTEIKGIVSRAVDEKKGAGAGHEDGGKLDELLRFKSNIAQILPQFQAALEDAREVVADHKALMASFKPTFDWVQAKMAEEEAGKEAHGGPAEAAGKSSDGQPHSDAPGEGASQPPRLPQAEGEG